MQLLRPRLHHAADERRGAALMLAFLVLTVLMLIVFQISIGTSTDARVARNGLSLAVFDEAIESAILKTMQDLADDAEAAAEADEGAGVQQPSIPGLGGLGGADDGADREATGPVDSREDSWGRPQQTEINGVSLRIFVQDEDSKYNVLTMLTPDDDEAEKAFDRVVRILDLCREGTTVDIDEGEARDMAEAMRDFLRDREDQELPQPSLLTDLQDEPGRGLPLTLREFLVLEPFTEHHFRDFRDHEGNVVHSIGAFLTVSTSVSTYQAFLDWLDEEDRGEAVERDEAAASGGSGGSSGSGGGSGGGGGSPGTTGDATGGSSAGTDTRGMASGADGGMLGDPTGMGGGQTGNGTPGIAVNVNTAPNAVLHGIMDRRDLDWGFLDELIEYRNLEDEEASGGDDEEPVYDEYGEEVIVRQIFDSLDELSEVYGWENLEPDARDEFLNFLTVESRVFSIYVTARKAINEDGEIAGFGATAEERRELEQRGTDLVRTVRAIVWRHEGDDGWVCVPLERWEVLEYQPFEVLDFPEDER